MCRRPPPSIGKELDSLWAAAWRCRPTHRWLAIREFYPAQISHRSIVVNVPPMKSVKEIGSMKDLGLLALLGVGLQCVAHPNARAGAGAGRNLFD